VRPLGAEDPQYAAAGLSRGAKDGPFLSEVELLQLLGMTEELYARIQPLVTVHSGAEGIDPLRAAPEVLRAVPGMTEDLAKALASAGEEEDPFELIDEDALFDMELYFIPSREAVYGIRAEARTRGGGVFVREAVIELTADPMRPYLVRAWRRGRLR